MTFQNRTASTSTGTVSLVSVFSAVKPVVMTRVSSHTATVSTIGIITNKPGPRSPRNCPSRRTTARSHGAATLTELDTTIAITNATHATTAASTGSEAAYAAADSAAPTIASAKKINTGTPLL